MKIINNTTIGSIAMSTLAVPIIKLLKDFREDYMEKQAAAADTARRKRDENVEKEKYKICFRKGDDLRKPINAPPHCQKLRNRLYNQE